MHYLSAPLTPLHLLERQTQDLKTRYRIAREGVTHLNGRLTESIPLALFAPCGVFPLNKMAVLRNWSRFVIAHSISTVLKAQPFDVVYIDNIFLGWLLDKVQYRTSVMRVMDRHDQFPGWASNAKQLAREVSEKCDLTVYSARGLEAYVKELGAQESFLVPNGVDYEFFRQVGAPDSSFAKRNRPVVAYSGTLDDRIDVGLVKYVAAALPQYSFEFFGPQSEGFSPDGFPDNVIFHGSVPHADLPAILHQADIGFIPFDIHRAKERLSGVRPLKLLEYMASGLPVVCARWPEVERMKSPAKLFSTPNECVEMLKLVELEKQSHAIEKEYARQADWSHMCSQLMDEIEKRAEPRAHETTPSLQSL
ncbi:glycosyltransferase involved in cell wall biosynthesis [Desulfobaculum xiamenense]|uniref:Glycosyltransferase involved in cell wall biosynthesis n=1 Tax=Desulfobaculum xiamenense TaxID=995050 RepID=A0A846QGZ9_9BACT|nr:glycosyltransferase involved in cell wall biosynthesis [Desulfobaculum xiamenense]